MTAGLPGCPALPGQLLPTLLPALQQLPEENPPQEVLQAPDDSDRAKQTLPLTRTVRVQRNHTLRDPLLPTQSYFKS